MSSYGVIMVWDIRLGLSKPVDIFHSGNIFAAQALLDSRSTNNLKKTKKKKLEHAAFNKPCEEAFISLHILKARLILCKDEKVLCQLYWDKDLQQHQMLLFSVSYQIISVLWNKLINSLYGAADEHKRRTLPKN